MIKLTQVKVEDCEAIKELMVEVWNDEHERWFQGKEGPRIPGYDSVKMQEYHRWDNQYNNLDVKENQTSLEMKRCKLAGSKIMDSDLTNVVIENCKVEGMIINGIKIEDLLQAYRNEDMYG